MAVGVSVGVTVGETVGIIVGEVVGLAVAVGDAPGRFLPATHANAPERITVSPFLTEIVVPSVIVAVVVSSESCPFPLFGIVILPTLVSPTITSSAVSAATPTDRTLTDNPLLPFSMYIAVPVGVLLFTADPVRSARSGPFGHCISSVLVLVSGLAYPIAAADAQTHTATSTSVTFQCPHSAYFSFIFPTPVSFSLKTRKAQKNFVGLTEKVENKSRLPVTQP